MGVPGAPLGAAPPAFAGGGLSGWPLDVAAAGRGLTGEGALDLAIAGGAADASAKRTLERTKFDGSLLGSRLTLQLKHWFTDGLWWG